MISIEKLPKRIKVVVLEKPEVLKVKQILMWPIESYGDPDMVLLKIKACGICGSDLRYFRGENPWSQHTLGKHIPNPPNIVLGHEMTGYVVAVLDKKNENLLGKRVAPICSKVCGKCFYCRTGKENLCPNTIHLGHGQGWQKQEYYPGAYSEYVPVWGTNCYEIPDNLSYDEATLLDILAVCVRATHQGKVGEDSSILVMGAGPCGNGIAQISRISGASKIIVAERIAARLELVRKQSFDLVINTTDKTNEELRKIVLKETDSQGCSSIFDTIGTEESFSLGLSLLDKGGTLVNIAVHDELVGFNQMALGGERSIVTTCNFKKDDYETALSWLADGRMNLEGWISIINLEEVPETFDKLLDGNGGTGESLKIIIHP